MADYFSSREVPQNVWTGVTVCDQSEANEKIPYLLQVKSKFRFVSIEPMLGPIDLTDIIAKETDCFEDHINALYCDVDVEDDTIYQGRTTNWVICGGESGGEARPMHPDWVISLRDQCKTYDVPFMFKQWGTWAPGECVNDLKKRETVVYTDGKWDKCSDDWITEADRGPIMYKVGKNHAGRLLDGIIYDEFPGVNNVE
jgi:protein gp37